MMTFAVQTAKPNEQTNRRTADPPPKPEGQHGQQVHDHSVIIDTHGVSFGGKHADYVLSELPVLAALQLLMIHPRSSQVFVSQFWCLIHSSSMHPCRSINRIQLFKYIFILKYCNILHILLCFRACLSLAFAHEVVSNKPCLSYFQRQA